MLVIIGGPEPGDEASTSIERLIAAQVGLPVGATVVGIPPATIDQMNYALRIEDAWALAGARTTALLIANRRDAGQVAARTVDAADVVYLGGGSLSFYAMLSGTPVERSIRRCARDGTRMVVGMSAGGLTMNGGYYEPGWGLLPHDLGVEVHAQRPHRLDRLIEWTRQDAGRLGVGLPDGSALLIDDNDNIEHIHQAFKVKGGEVSKHV